MADKTILIVDYGMGNIGSVCNALDLLGGRYVVSNRGDDVDSAHAIILPGVGAFGAAMRNLTDLGLVEPLTRRVMNDGVPFLGICLGMQLIAQDSVENGFDRGLGWIDGHVLAMEPAEGLRVPHVGWNSVTPRDEGSIFARIGSEANFYFDHSFHVTCDDEWVAASCDYGRRYVAAIRKANIVAVQFHPEKSQRNGLKLLRNFLNAVHEPSR